MTLDNLTIRVYKEPSYLVMLDGQICRYYPHLNQMIPLSEEMESELYCFMNEWRYGERVEEYLDHEAEPSFESFIVEINSKFYRYYPKEDMVISADSLPPENCSFSTANWTELPEVIRQEYVLESYPDSSPEDHLIMVYGKEKAEEFLEHEQWIESHVVHDLSITYDIETKIGRFSKVRELDSGYFFPDNTDLDKTKYFRYMIDDRWLVTVIDRHDPFEDLEEDLMFYSPKDRPTYRMLTRINELKELPWNLLNILDLKPE